MLEGKKLMLATVPYAKEDVRKSWFHTISTMLVLAAFIAGSLFIDFLPLRLLFSIGIGLTLVRFFIIYHDYLHKAILQKSSLAKGIFTVFGWYILAPTSIWQRSHDYHHQHNSKLYTSNIGSFPIVTKEKYLEFTAKERFVYLFIRHPLTIACGYFFAFLYGMCIRSFVLATAKHWDCMVGVLFHFGIGALIFWLAGWDAALITFLIPAFISSALGSYLFYAQHNFPGATFQSKEGWTYIHAAMESSSYMRMNALMRWFTGNIGYHHIHHMNARIPFYNLPKVYKDIPEFQVAKVTRLTPREIWRCLTLKVWDFDKQRMLSLSEIRS